MEEVKTFVREGTGVTPKSVFRVTGKSDLGVQLTHPAEVEKVEFFQQEVPPQEQVPGKSRFLIHDARPTLRCTCTCNISFYTRT